MSLEYLKVMYFYIFKKEVFFVVGLFVGEMFEKLYFLSIFFCK